jgi:hypothetical protein
MLWRTDPRPLWAMTYRSGGGQRTADEPQKAAGIASEVFRAVPATVSGALAVGEHAVVPIGGSISGRHYSGLAGPIWGARTGLAMPKKITTPCPPQRVESASWGLPIQLPISCQLFIAQTLPAGSTAISVCI